MIHQPCRAGTRATLRPGRGVLDPSVRARRVPAVLSRVGVVVPPHSAGHVRDRAPAGVVVVVSGGLHPVRAADGVAPREVAVRPRARGDGGHAGAAGDQRDGPRQQRRHRYGRPEREGEEHERAEEDQRGERGRERDARQDQERGQGDGKREEAQELGGGAVDVVERLDGASEQRALLALRRRRRVAAPGGGGAGRGCAWPERRPVCHGEARERMEGESSLVAGRWRAGGSSLHGVKVQGLRSRSDVWRRPQCCVGAWHARRHVAPNGTVQLFEVEGLATNMVYFRKFFYLALSFLFDKYCLIMN